MRPTADPALAKRLGALFDSRWDRQYVPAKLRSDPLYGAVLAELRESSLPLLDLGCGLGLLALFLHAHDCNFPIRGLDYDARKIAAANAAAAKIGATAVSFDHCDARCGLPDHCGNVTILDILQFLSADEQSALLRAAVERVAPGGKLIIRSGLRDSSARFRITVAGDLLAKLTFWMKSAPHHYPSAASLRAALEPYGPLRITPLHAGTPFNNHLIVLGPLR